MGLLSPERVRYIRKVRGSSQKPTFRRSFRPAITWLDVDGGVGSETLHIVLQVQPGEQVRASVLKERPFIPHQQSYVTTPPTVVSSS